MVKSRRTIALGNQTNGFVGAPLGQHGDPVLDHFRRVTVNFQPREGLPEDGAMRQRALRSYARRQVAKTPLQSEDLTQSFQIAARERQVPQLGEHGTRPHVGFPTRTRASRQRGQIEWHEQAAEQHGVGQRLGRR